MKKLFLNFLFTFFLLPSLVLGSDTFSLTSYYPAPNAVYKSIQLKPQSVITPATSCPIGTIYSNSDDASNLYYCAPGSTVSRFIPIGGVWTLNTNDLYLSDTSTPTNKKVGIGTTTPTFKLTLDVDGGILSTGTVGSGPALTTSGAGTRLIWDTAKSSFRAGTVDGTQWDPGNIQNFTYVQGHNNRTRTEHSRIFGGEDNVVGDPANDYGHITVIGGKSNSNYGAWEDFIGGGENNQINYSYLSIISGGKNNQLNRVDEYSRENAILGGADNSSNTTNSYIGGGQDNHILSPSTSSYQSYSSIGGGAQNLIQGTTHNVINGGQHNVIFDLSSYSFIGGGSNHELNGTNCTISGGSGNTIYGIDETTPATSSTISGGSTNAVIGDYSTISGGLSNGINAHYATIPGGHLNYATGQYSIILGGESNNARATASSIWGGTNNTTWGDYSVAMGKNMNLGANADRSFMWGHSDTALASAIQSPDSFIIYSGTVGIGDNNPGALLEINVKNGTDDFFALSPTSAAAAGSDFIIKNNGYVGVGTNNPTYPMQFISGAYVSTTGLFMSASSRKYKMNISDLSFQKASTLLSELQPVRFNYKNDPQEQYLGFIAEDVPEALVDQTRRGLAPLDFTAVLTKIVANQRKILDQQEQLRSKYEKEIEELEKDLGQK